jgi:hypothetical protein
MQFSPITRDFSHRFRDEKSLVCFQDDSRLSVTRMSLAASVAREMANGELVACIGRFPRCCCRHVANCSRLSSCAPRRSGRLTEDTPSSVTQRHVPTSGRNARPTIFAAHAFTAPQMRGSHSFHHPPDVPPRRESPARDRTLLPPARSSSHAHSHSRDRRGRCRC